MSTTSTHLPNSNIEDQYSVPDGEERSSFVILSGCSGGGKSTLLSELAKRGYSVVSEPGRQIVKEQIGIGGASLPWTNKDMFAELLLSRYMFSFNSASETSKYTFFDRSIIDIVAYYDHIGQTLPEHFERAVRQYRYHRKVFLTPPWPEIYRNDSERKHTFAQAAASYDAHIKAYERLGYEVFEMPKASASERADFILENLS